MGQDMFGIKKLEGKNIMEEAFELENEKLI